MSHDPPDGPLDEALDGPLDEALDPAGTDRPHTADVMAAVRSRGPATLAAEVRSAAARSGVVHEKGLEDHPFTIDPVPRVITAEEWDPLAAGLAQRVRALEAFVADSHGRREAVRAGVVPAEVVDTNRYALGRYGLALPPPRLWIGLAGPDVVRGADGRFVVLEDNVRTPTMLAYALAARDAVAPLLGVRSGPRPLREPAREALRRMLRAAAGPADAVVAVLDDGGRPQVRWEIARLAELVDAPAVRPEDLSARGDALHLPDGRRVDLLWRRTSEERLHDDAGRVNALGELLLRPLRAGTVAVVNAFGTGVADDKRTYPYVEDLVRFFCGEEPLLPSVPAYDLGDPAQRAAALPRLAELVLKPRSGSGGHGVLIGPRATRAQLEEARRAVEADPGGWIAQEPVAISTSPTVVDGELAPRHVDLRPFAVHDGAGVTVLPGGLTRVALRRGDLVVNVSQGGGGKDTWVR